MKALFCHPTGNANVRAAAVGLAEANILAVFYTTYAMFPGQLADKISSLELFSELSRRRFDRVLKPFTMIYPWLEFGRLMASKAGLRSLTRHETGIFSIDAVYRDMDKRAASSLKKFRNRGVEALYAYEDGAVLSFSEAKRLGLTCFYDLPIGYWRAAQKYLKIEQARWPEWTSTMPGFIDSQQKLMRKDEELKLADYIFVASQFTAKTLEDYPGNLAPVEVIPYGFPRVFTNREYALFAGRRRLKLLFVGSLSQRKGIANLFAAVEKLKDHVELTVVGHKVDEECFALDAALSNHCWIPSLPYKDILELMKAQDVLVFPSLFEGFGLVITEAMSQGTPVITTNRTAGPDFIEHGHNGWIIEAGSTSALQMALENLLVKPDIIKQAGRAAMETARNRPWSVYGRELAMAIHSRLGSSI